MSLTRRSLTIAALLASTAAQAFEFPKEREAS